LLPAIIYGIFAFNNWSNSIYLYGSYSNVRPMEPALPIMAIGLICFEIAVCLLASAAGGWLARAALKQELNDQE
jgi:hypothetical protein